MLSALLRCAIKRGFKIFGQRNDPMRRYLRAGSTGCHSKPMKAISVIIWPLVLAVCLLFVPLQAQESAGVVTQRHDNPSVAPVVLSDSVAAAYLSNLLKTQPGWVDRSTSPLIWLYQLLLKYHEPWDSIRQQLENYPWNRLEWRQTTIQETDTLPLRWLSTTHFMVDTFRLKQDPVLVRKTIVYSVLEETAPWPADSIAALPGLPVPRLGVRDTLYEAFIDSNLLKFHGIQLYQWRDGIVMPSIEGDGPSAHYSLLPDSSAMVITQEKDLAIPVNGIPASWLRYPGSRDSLQAAVQSLLSYTLERDSIPLWLRDVKGKDTPVWLKGGRQDMLRHWVHNASEDSVTVWIGNPERNTLTLALEDGIFIQRLEKREMKTPIPLLKPDLRLLPVSPMKEMHVFWDYGTTQAFSLNQNYLSYWSKGGESSLAALIDMAARARYTARDRRMHWTSDVRLKYGAIRTKQNGYRTSTDILEMNSQYNRRMREKWDFSGVFYFKTQVARGYQYPNDSTVISRFLNPGSFTIGMGFEYKPVKDMLIHIAPLSYKNTFVLDTGMINPGLHGIEKGKRSRQELGGQLVMRNKMEILEGLKMTNAIRLFSNYIEKPQNVDVDWEMSLDKQINWLFTVKLNLHVIYDDDVRFPVLMADGKPELLPDGSQRKVARMQLNQFLGLTFQFRL